MKRHLILGRRGAAGWRGAEGWTGAVVLAGLLFFSCSKHGGSALTGGGAIAYVTGDDGTHPILWRNGIPQQLSATTGFGAQVLVSGNDVYVAGASNETMNGGPGGPGGKFGYWKNGVETGITSGFLINTAMSITVDGDDVYFSFFQLFRNGTVYPLPGMGSGGSVCAGMSVGNSVYFAGRDSIGDGVYWVNGVPHLFASNTPGNPGPQLLCMYVSGGDVYIGGVDGNGFPGLWKNGVQVTIQQPVDGSRLSSVRSLFVADGDVYFTGTVYNGVFDLPAYWKNGAEVKLPLDGASQGTANSIFVNGTDVYVAGATSHGATLWTNGIGTLLAAGGEGNSVVVK